jgi:WD40 repeat protein
VTFQSDVTRIAAGYSDSSVRLYDVTKLTSGVGGNSGGGGGGPKSKAAGGGSNVVIKEEEEEDEEESRLNRATTFLYGHTGPVHALDFTHDARLLLSGSADGTVRVWGTELGAGGWGRGGRDVGPLLCCC